MSGTAVPSEKKWKIHIIFWAFHPNRNKVTGLLSSLSPEVLSSLARGCVAWLSGLRSGDASSCLNGMSVFRRLDRWPLQDREILYLASIKKCPYETPALVSMVTIRLALGIGGPCLVHLCHQNQSASVSVRLAWHWRWLRQANIANWKILSTIFSTFMISTSSSY